MIDLLANVPNRVHPKKLRRYHRWRMNDLGKVRTQRDIRASAEQKVAHTSGNRSFVVGYGEMVYM